MWAKLEWVHRFGRWIAEKWIAYRGGRMPGNGSIKVVLILKNEVVNNHQHYEPFEFLVDFKKGETLVAVEKRVRRFFRSQN